LASLTSAANRIITGDYNVNINIPNPKEFNLLGKTFGIMTTKIGELIADLRETLDERKQTNERILALNNQLTESERELKISNEQLFANESYLKATIQRLIESERKYKTVLDTSTSAIFIGRTDGKIIDFNKSAYNVFNYSESEFAAMSLADIVLDSVAEMLSALFISHATTGGMFIESLGKRKDGSVFPIELSTRIITLNNENFIVVFVRDITQRKRDEQDLKIINEQLRNANEELKSLDEMKTNILSNVSHELRTPLVAIRGYTELIASGKSGAISTKQAHQLEICIKSIDRLTQLIENLIKISRLETGKESLVLEIFDLSQILTEALDVIEIKAKKTNIRLIRKLSRPLVLKADKNKLMQVVLNLLDNAVKFTAERGEIIVEAAYKNENDIEVSIKDNGIGIPADKIPKIFDRFYQIDSSTTRRYGGLGIGLALCKNIIDMHKGVITVASEENKGSVFTFVIPKNPEL